MSKRHKVTSARKGKYIRKSAYESSRCYTLDTLPPEVLEMILRLIPLHDVASTVRLVSRRCSTVATTVLNAAFLAAGSRLETAIRHVNTAMSRVKTDSELLNWSKTFNSLELINAQYKMLKAVTWRYTHPLTQEKFPRLCFYAGSLLDDLDKLIRRTMEIPVTLNGSSSLTSINHFVTLCKRFMNYFEKNSERKINRSVLISGCKAVDVLDCLAEGREVLSFKVTSEKGRKTDIISMKLRYVIKRAWFTCLEVPSIADENSWRDEQRFMYLRLRRLVGSVNEHLFEKLHYDRELHLRTKAPTMPSPRLPPASTYSGYGEYGGKFFYYGNMNKYAYESKFKFPERIDWDNAHGDTEEEMHTTPCFDLVIVVDLRCSPELAPLAVRVDLKTDDFETSNTTVHNYQQLYLKLNVTCPASIANRLPGNFTWELRSSRSGRP